MFLSEHSSVQPHLRKDRKKVQDDHKFKKLRFEEDFKEPMSRKEKMRDKIVRPQSGMTIEKPFGNLENVFSIKRFTFFNI